MPLVPLAIQPGMFKNGTDYFAKGRWGDGDMVRWTEGSARPIGGWQRVVNTVTQIVAPPLFGDPTVEAARNMISWRQISGTIVTVVGTNLGLYAIDGDNVVTDITPTIGFSGGDKDGQSNLLGFGVGPYGAEAYGTPRANASQLATQIFTWTFAIWGEDLIVAPRGNNETIYSWSPGDVRAEPLSNAPGHSRGVAVTDQRILVSIGDNVNNRLISWSDSEDNTNWTPAVTNQSGSQTLGGVGIFHTIINVGRVMLILSENDAYIMRYIGPPYIFGFERIGDSTLMVSDNAVAVISDIAIWWGYRNFWIFDGNTITPIPCDVMDFLASDIAIAAQGKITAHPNAKFKEVWWHYQSRNSATTEPDSYVAFNYVDKLWFTGRLDRTVGADGSALTDMLMVKSSGELYNHELETVVPENPNFLISGPIELGNGEQISYINYIYPDTPVQNHLTPPPDTDSDATITLICRDFPNSAPINYGPYPMTRPSPIRARGRQFSLRIDGNNDLWEQGITRVNIIPGGPR